MVKKELIATLAMELVSLALLVFSGETTWIAKEFSLSSNTELISFFLPISITAFVLMFGAVGIFFRTHPQESHGFITGSKIRNLFIALIMAFAGAGIILIYLPGEMLQLASQIGAILFWVFIGYSYYKSRKGQWQKKDAAIPGKLFEKTVIAFVIIFYILGILFFAYSPQEGALKNVKIAWETTNTLLTFALIPALLGAVLAELVFYQPAQKLGKS